MDNAIERGQSYQDSAVEKALGRGASPLWPASRPIIAEQKREGREDDRAIFLEAWNGNQRIDTGCIGRGCISIPNLCISIHTPTLKGENDNDQ